MVDLFLQLITITIIGPAILILSTPSFLVFRLFVRKRSYWKDVGNDLRSSYKRTLEWLSFFP